jgi:hypothetical protein
MAMAMPYGSLQNSIIKIVGSDQFVKYNKQALEIGAEAMKNAALHFHPVQDEGATGDGTVLLN